MNLGREMKKLKESVHAIQVGCDICEGVHLAKDCPLTEEEKKVKKSSMEMEDLFRETTAMGIESDHLDFQPNPLW